MFLALVMSLKPFSTLPMIFFLSPLVITNALLHGAVPNLLALGVEDGVS